MAYEWGFSGSGDVQLYETAGTLSERGEGSATNNFHETRELDLDANTWKLTEGTRQQVLEDERSVEYSGSGTYQYAQSGMGDGAWLGAGPPRGAAP